MGACDASMERRSWADATRRKCQAARRHVTQDGRQPRRELRGDPKVPNFQKATAGDPGWPRESWAAVAAPQPPRTPHSASLQLCPLTSRSRPFCSSPELLCPRNWPTVAEMQRIHRKVGAFLPRGEDDAQVAAMLAEFKEVDQMLGKASLLSPSQPQLARTNCRAAC